jgi:hypothetical protein
MDTAQIWRAFFAEWPAGLPPRGVLVTSFDDQIPFSSYWTADSLLILERRTPDAMGGRQVIIPYGKIEAVKVTDPVNTQIFTAAGFRPATDKSRGVSQ